MPTPLPCALIRRVAVRMRLRIIASMERPIAQCKCTRSITTQYPPIPCAQTGRKIAHIPWRSTADYTTITFIVVFPIYLLMFVLHVYCTERRLLPTCLLILRSIQLLRLKALLPIYLLIRWAIQLLRLRRYSPVTYSYESMYRY